ncbi:MAG: hypothetical protein HRT61_24985 [Ekhidna sp.]|nr:hypothetical protein [Ekhidna sp.]
MVSLESFKSWFDIEEESENEVLMSTRQNGNVGDGTYGQQDLDKAREIKENILNQYPSFDINIETTDEWVSILVKNG